MRLLEKLVAKLGEYGVYCDVVNEYANDTLAGKRIVSDQEVILDFTEHDKKVTAEKDAQIAESDRMRISWIETAQSWSEENAELKTRNEKMEKENKELRERLNFLRQRCNGEAVEFFDRNMYGSLIISCPPITDTRQIAELEEKLKDVCFENAELKIALDVMSKRNAELKERYEL